MTISNPYVSSPALWLCRLGPFLVKGGSVLAGTNRVHPEMGICLTGVKMRLSFSCGEQRMMLEDAVPQARESSPFHQRRHDNTPETLIRTADIPSQERLGDSLDPHLRFQPRLPAGCNVSRLHTALQSWRWGGV